MDRGSNRYLIVVRVALRYGLGLQLAEPEGYSPRKNYVFVQ